MSSPEQVKLSYFVHDRFSLSKTYGMANEALYIPNDSNGTNLFLWKGDFNPRDDQAPVLVASTKHFVPEAWNTLWYYGLVHKLTVVAAQPDELDAYIEAAQYQAPEAEQAVRLLCSMLPPSLYL